MLETVMSEDLHMIVVDLCKVFVCNVNAKQDICY